MIIAAHEGAGEAGIMFINRALHLATLAALVIYFSKDISRIVKGFSRGWQPGIFINPK